MNEPVVILYKSKPGTCHHCSEVSSMWDVLPKNSSYNLSITESIKKVNPNVRFFTVTAFDREGHFDENLIPKDLIRYGVRFPQIILVPGKLWNLAIQNLGPNNDIKLIEGVKVMNYRIVDDNMHYDAKYNSKIPSEYEKWFRECLVQDSSTQDNKILQSIKTNDIVKSNNITRPIRHHKEKKEYSISEYKDVCVIKLVSTQKK